VSEPNLFFETRRPRRRPPARPTRTLPFSRGAFQPVPVESPGGGRIKDKRDPSPADIVEVPRAGGGSIPLHRLAAQALDAMTRAVRAEGIVAPLLMPVSGYRSAATQAKLWKTALAKAGGDAKEARKWVAPPGGSAHQSGRAVDLYLGYTAGKENVAAMRGTAVWQWLERNAARFGFYPYGTEPWHWEYNPPASPGTVIPARPGQAPTPPLPSSAGNLTYTVVAGQEYGSKWRSQRPPGLPAKARPASAQSAAVPWIEQLARAEGLGDIFVRTVRRLAETESGARFGLPANIFDARLPEQRPPGKPLITAWGAFQFNRDAWRALPEVSAAAFPWDCTPQEEIARPIARYARLYHDVVAAGGGAIDAARGIRLWHITPAGFGTYLKTGRSSGFGAAWQQVPADQWQQIDERLRESGILS
jgi:D-alanyl-D-alanine carboxypeptidase